MTCLRCGSEDLIPNVLLVERDSGDQRKPVEVQITRKPGATFFKDHLRIETTAKVCADCGFVEITAKNPGALWDAYIERSANTWKD